MIKFRNIDATLKSLILGMALGDIWFLNGDLGDNNSNGEDFGHAFRTLNHAARKLVSGHHDYILCCGAETGTAELALTLPDAHIIGVGNGGVENVAYRGFQYTCPATVDTISLSAAADGVEIAGIHFICSATDHILVDDAGADNFFFHHNNVLGSGTASDAVRLDLEGSYATIADNLFYLCKLAIDIGTAGHYDQVLRNTIQDVDVAAIGINVAVGDYGVIANNFLNLSGTTGDTGVKIAAGANYWIVAFNLFHSGLSDNISDAGTGTFKVGNAEGAITGTTATSILLATED